MDHLRATYNVWATAVFLIAIITAHLFAPSNYDWHRNTISDLGAQGYDRNGIMRAGFVAFGVLLILGTVMNGIGWRQAPILLYGLCVALTGVFCTKPFTGDAPYNAVHASLHSAFAQAAGVLFTAGLVMHIYLTSATRERLIHAVFLVGVMGLSATFGLSNAYSGVFQRLLYLVSFLWLVRWFRP